MDTNIEVNIQEYNFKENLNAINYKFKNILEDLYSDSSVKKDHVPPLKTIYKSYIENKSYTDVILRHMSFPVFLAILIDIDIDRLEDFLRSTSPALNINRTYLCDFNSLELVRLWVEEIIFEYLSCNCWFDKDMLLDILNQFKKIFHGRCEYIIKYYDQFIEFKQNIYSIDRIKNCTNNIERCIRNASEEFSIFILFDSYKTCITNFNEYIQYYDLIPEVLDINKIRDMHKSDNNEYECRLGMKVKTNDDLMSKVDYLEEAIEVDTNNDNCSNE